jgi:hypothetical protein
MTASLHTPPSADPPHRDPRVDDYIARAAPFARPILAHLRHVVHAACPEAVETIKWGMPFFEYRGNLCHMAAFKGHCAFGLWRGKEIEGLPDVSDEPSMGSFGRIGSVDDLPPRRRLTTFIKAAMKLDDSGVKPSRATAKRAPLAMPDDFAAALAAHPDASARFASFSATAVRDYVEWIVEARREATRATRIATAVQWIADGKPRHWKYRK